MQKYIYQNNMNILNSNLSDNNEINQKSFESSDNSSLNKKRENLYEENSMSDVTFRYSNDNNYNEGINNNQLDSSSYLNGNKEGSFEAKQNENIINNSNVEKESFKNIIDIIQNILKSSEITLNINNNNKESEENKKNKEIEYGKMIYREGVGIIYEDFKKYFSKEKDQKLVMEFSEIFFENYKKLIEFLEKIKIIAKTKFSFISLKLIIKIKLKEEEETKNNNNCIKNIISEYKIEIPYFLEKIYQDKNILKFASFSENIVKLFQNKSTINTPSLITSSIPIINSKVNINSYNNSKELINSIKEYKLIMLKKFIGKHKIIAGKIRELDNKIKGLDDVSFISDGYNEIFIYDIDLNNIGDYTFKNYYNFFVFKDEVIISQKNKLTFLTRINTNNQDNKTNFSCRNLFKLKDNKYILCNENGLYLYMGFKNIDSNYELKKLSFRGGIKITDEIVAITSNSILQMEKTNYFFLIQLQNHL